MVYFEWNNPNLGKILVIDYNDYAGLRQALNSPVGSVNYVIDSSEALFKGLMPKNSTVQANRAKRYYDHMAGMRNGDCPFEQNTEGVWVKK